MKHFHPAGRTQTTWVADQVRIGNFEKVYFTQIWPDNFRYYDGLIRTTIYGAYGKPITGPHLPEVFLTEAENRTVADVCCEALPS